MSNLDHLSFLERLYWEFIECPICREYGHLPLLACENGHLICRDCAVNYKKHECPICKDPRPFLHQSLIESPYLIRIFQQFSLLLLPAEFLDRMGKIRCKNKG